MPDIYPAHRISAAAICRLARAAGPVPREALLPEYVRAPDATAPGAPGPMSTVADLDSAA